jgi:hypothetical protein
VAMIPVNPNFFISSPFRGMLGLLLVFITQPLAR